MLRRERDKLSLELIEARAQLVRCNTAWNHGQPANQPNSQPSKAEDARPAHAAGIGRSFTAGDAADESSRVESHPSRGGSSRSLQQEALLELQCSTVDVKAVSAVATDENKTNSLLARMAMTNAGCAECLQSCAQFDYRAGCLFRCQHQRENECTDTTKIASMIPGATLQDRRWLVSMIEQVSASCAYCILETVESVGGSGSVKETMHITTDYPILPRPCFAELADALKSKPLAPQLPQECLLPSRVTVTAHTDSEGVVQLNVPTSASPLDVACILAKRFRRSEGDARLATMIVLSAGIGPIMMLADLIVNSGETVRIVAEPGTRATVVVGERQLQVCAVSGCEEQSLDPQLPILLTALG